MAEILYGTVSSILFKLGSDAFQELRSNFKVSKELDQELENLQDTLDTIKASLHDAEQAAESDKLVKKWISRLQNVVYDADDLLDEFQYEQLRQKVHPERKSQVRIHLSSLNPLSSRSKMGYRVKQIRERLEKVAADFDKFSFVKRGKIDMGVSDPKKIDLGVGKNWRETDSSIKSQIIGRTENKRDIINLLLEPTSNQGNNSIVAIVGIGGLGKTALAQLVYNEARIESHFSSKFWVCVSEEFDSKLLIEKILKSAPGKKEIVSADLDLQQLQGQLKDILGGKRYLIVLDDVWNEDPLRWDNFLEHLVDGAPGSKILVTTRSRKVALAMGINSPYVLEGLDSDESWVLFEHVAFKGQNKIDTKLEKIGKEVVDRCKGVPLAIKTLASLLRLNPYENFWSSIKEDREAWKTSLETEVGIFPVLKLSYSHLPSHLRPCFAFCAIFPKDFDIPKDRLIQLWNALGYIQSSSRNKRSLELGDEYYNDLLSRSFFQEEDEDFDGNISCKMHDLMHDLAQSVAGSSFSTVKDDKQKIPKEVRHLFLECKLSQKFCTYLFETKGMIRTMVKFTDFSIEEIQIPRFSRNPLRILALRYMDIKKLPNSNGRLKHLRFLDLSHNGNIEVLPDFITDLYNLQTLLLDGCENLKKLPKDISKLISLEYLDIKGCDELKYLPKGLGELTSLQRLSNFIVNIDEKEFSNSATLNELRDLNYLGGNLEISNLDMVRNVELESNEANLKEKTHLESLTFEWGDKKDRNNEKDELLLDNIEPHPNLKKLKIKRYPGARFSRWLSSITNLVRLEINNSRCCQQLPRLDHLPSLEYVRLDSLSALEYVADDGVGKEASSLSCSTSTTKAMFFPSLKELRIEHCNNLKGWWRRKNENEESTSELPCFPCLSSLEISYSPNLTFMPLFPFLDNLLLQKASTRPLQQTLMMKTNKTSTASTSSASSSRSSSTAPLSNLKKLTLRRIDDLETLPEEFQLNLTSLEYLRFEDCKKLEFLLLKRTHCLTSLKTLEFEDCPNLTVLPEWIPTLSSLRCLEIIYCPQVSFLPGGIHHLTSLEELKLSNLRSLPEWIPTLTSLKYLQINDCPQESFLPGGLHCLTSLEKLELSNCPNLTALPTLTSLKYLQINDCPQVSFLPEGIHHLTSLEELELRNLSSLPEWIPTLTSLKYLQINDCPQVSFLPGGIHCLTSLEKLELSKCPNLTALLEWIPTLTSLRCLQINDCPQVSFLPGGIHHLTSLEELKLSNLRALPEWIPTLTSLKYLQINDCPQVSFLPGGIHHLTSLEELDLSNLTALPEWIPTLTSLKYLRIKDCPQVLSLPRGMQRLTSLKALQISGCPRLSETCKVETGIDWPQIAKIPNICIEDSWVQGKPGYGFYGMMAELHSCNIM